MATDPFDDPGEPAPKILLAAFDSSCPACFGWIAEGTEIVMGPDGAHHARADECDGEVPTTGMVPGDRFYGTTSEEMGF